jgi:hypothetical protein
MKTAFIEHPDGRAEYGGTLGGAFLFPLLPGRKWGLKRAQGTIFRLTEFF